MIDIDFLCYLIATVVYLSCYNNTLLNFIFTVASLITCTVTVVYLVFYFIFVF